MNLDKPIDVEVDFSVEKVDVTALGDRVPSSIGHVRGRVIIELDAVGASIREVTAELMGRVGRINLEDLKKRVSNEASLWGVTI